MLPLALIIMESRQHILSTLVEHLKEFGAPPASVYRFCKDAGIPEKDFFSAFGSFEAAESAYWAESLTHVIQSVESGEAWQGFNARERQLAFLYAYFEHALEHRSLLLNRLNIGIYQRPAYLRGFETRHKNFAKSIIEHGITTGEIADRGRLGMLYPEALHLHFRSVIDFYLKDMSEGFVKTDAYIEKSVALAFDVLRSQALDSAVDLARFLIPKNCASADKAA